jgi:hypothetical protein
MLQISRSVCNGTQGSGFLEIGRLGCYILEGGLLLRSVWEGFVAITKICFISHFWRDFLCFGISERSCPEKNGLVLCKGKFKTQNINENYRFNQRNTVTGFWVSQNRKTRMLHFGGWSPLMLIWKHLNIQWYSIIYFLHQYKNMTHLTLEYLRVSFNIV